MAKTLKDRIVEILLASKKIKEDQLKGALDIHKAKGGNLAAILIEKGLVTQQDVVMILSNELNIPPINLARYKIDFAVIDLIPERIAKQYLLIPISKIGNHLTVAMSDPFNIFAIDDMKTLTNYHIDPVIATESDIVDAINTYYKKDTLDVAALVEKAHATEDLTVVGEEKIDIGILAEESTKAPVIKMVDLIIAEALKKRSSDIHVEPLEDALRIRYRVDGNLQEAFTLPKKNQNAVIARLKIMSKLDITESRIPQDGRFRIRLDEKEIDFRVSILPTTFGGKIVLRALDKSNLSIGLERLGFLPRPLAVFRDAISRPFGMILITGPTGSGKSTTLYSIITQLNTIERNIITVEDPVEYQVEGITQIQAKPEIGLTFASGLRSLLRQSPDIIMVGEIRDSETADIAIKASLTGELVLSTLHTNDAAGAVTRLIDMGVEPFLVASSVVMIGAQRLCRKLCQACREEYERPQSVLDRIGIDYAKAKREGKAKFMRGRGCNKCNNTGYYGRIAILEAFLIDDKIREMIVNRGTTDEIKTYAIKNGMMTLRDNAVELFTSGMTTLEEVLRVTSED